MELVLGYERKKDVLELFQQYTESILKQGPDVRECLQAQHYEDEVQNLEEKYGLPNGRLYLAVIGEEAVGCGALTYNSDEYCEIKRLYVKPEHRGKRIGQFLIEQVVSDAREIGYKYMRLDTFPFMENAIKLYERNGFKFIDKYNDNPSVSAIFMQKDL